MVARFRPQVMRGIIGLGTALGLMIWIVLPWFGDEENPITTAAPSDAIEMVLSVCHGEKLKSATEMASSSVHLYHSEEEDEFNKDDIMLGAGRLMKIRWVDGDQDLRCADTAWTTKRGESSREVQDEAEIARLDRFQSLIRATLLEPLYEAESVERRSETSFSITTKRGESWQLDLRTCKSDKGKELLLPDTLSSSHGKLRFAKYRYQGFNNLPLSIAIEGLGEWRFKLHMSGVTWLPAVFEPRRVSQKAKAPPVK